MATRTRKTTPRTSVTVRHWAVVIGRWLFGSVGMARMLPPRTFAPGSDGDEHDAGHGRRHADQLAASQPLVEHDAGQDDRGHRIERREHDRDRQRALGIREQEEGVAEQVAEADGDAQQRPASGRRWAVPAAWRGCRWRARPTVISLAASGSTRRRRPPPPIDRRAGRSRRDPAPASTASASKRDRGARDRAARWSGAGSRPARRRPGRATMPARSDGGSRSPKSKRHEDRQPGPDDRHERRADAHAPVRQHAVEGADTDQPDDRRRPAPRPGPAAAAPARPSGSTNSRRRRPSRPSAPGRRS